MKLRDGGLIIIGIIIAAAAVGYMSSKWLGDDNKIEENCERIIYTNTGVNIDLSPTEGEEQGFIQDVEIDILHEKIKDLAN